MMPKIDREEDSDEEEYMGDDEESIEEELEDIESQIDAPQGQRPQASQVKTRPSANQLVTNQVRKPGRPVGTTKKKPQNPSPMPRDETAKPQKNLRFSAFNSPERIGILDVETGEVIAEGPYATLQLMAEILERLERIENTLGSMIEQ